MSLSKSPAGTATTSAKALDTKALFDQLEHTFGPQQAPWPVEPYAFLIWWHCGYPASDRACEKGWNALTKVQGLAPQQLLEADLKHLAAALKAGGMVPDLRALRLKEIAARVLQEHQGDLESSLRSLSASEARKALRKFPNIGDPGADRILLFAGHTATAAVPSNCPHVLVRLSRGKGYENYGRNYQTAQAMLEAEIPAALDARRRAYLLLKALGQQFCKASKPKCGDCPVAGMCRFAATSCG